jgi:prevent-host-death family protein
MASKLYNLYEAKTALSGLVDRAAAGEEVIIAKAGKPMARLVALAPAPRVAPGAWAGRLWIAADFDAPLPDEVLDAFEGTGGPGEPP